MSAAVVGLAYVQAAELFLNNLITVINGLQP